jgi:type VI secretion system protein ImpK
VNSLDKTIIEICFPLFNLVNDFINKNNCSDLQLLQSNIMNEFFNIEELLKSSGMSDSVCVDVKFVMSAFLDEMILKRGDDLSSSWSKDSLQIKFFKENLSGEKFFERLFYFQRFSDKRFDILELYYWCLELGYEGKYCKSDSNDLKVIKENLRSILKLNQIKNYSKIDFKEILSPKDLASVTRPRKISLKIFVLIIFLSGSVVYGVQTLIVKYLLNGLKLLSTSVA